MHLPTLAVSDFIALATLLGATLGFVWKFVNKVRTNDLHHLDEKIDLHHAAVTETMDRIEGKIDTHIRDHAKGEFELAHHE